MAGQPKRQAAYRAFREHEDQIFEAIADGFSIREVAKRFGGVGREIFYHWLEQSSPETKQRWAEARKRSAEAHAEKALDVLDEAGNAELLIPAEVSLAREKSGYHRWLAGVLDKDTFGPPNAAGVQVNLNIGELHLNALKAGGGAPAHLQGREVAALPPAVEEEE